MTTSLWLSLVFSSTGDTPTLSQIISSFEEQVQFVDRTLKLGESFLNPDKSLDDKPLSSTVQGWVKSYMPRFYDKETYFKEVDSLVQKAAKKNPLIKDEYEKLQAIQWNNVNITYKQLRKNLQTLITFYQTYSNDIVGKQIPMAAEPVVPKALTPQSTANETPSNVSHTQNPKNHYFIKLFELKKRLASFISNVILNIKSFINRFYR